MVEYYGKHGQADPLPECIYNSHYGNGVPAMGFRQCLSLSVIQLKGKHCWKRHCRIGVVDTFGHCTKLGADNFAKNTPDALEFNCPTSKPKSSGFQFVIRERDHLLWKRYAWKIVTYYHHLSHDNKIRWLSLSAKRGRYCFTSNGA